MTACAVCRCENDEADRRCLSCGLPNDPKIEPAVQEAFKDVFPDGKRILWGDFTRAFVLECAPSVLDCRSRKLLRRIVCRRPARSRKPAYSRGRLCSSRELTLCSVPLKK